MNNEPVAWMSPKGLVYGLHETRPLECNIPLYTNPVDLTDAEIGEIYMDLHDDPIAFARAILREATENGRF